jgi:antitoxin component YwqK of YwqJK toxin-antitoxin module
MKTYETTCFPDGTIKLKFETRNGEKHGEFVRFHENGQKAVETQFVSDSPDGTWTEWYSNGQIAEEGTYVDSEYLPKNFWTENGEQTLVEGTGKVIRMFGADDLLVVEEYFERGEYKGEKKQADVRYGKFYPK